MKSTIDLLRFYSSKLHERMLYLLISVNFSTVKVLHYMYNMSIIDFRNYGRLHKKLTNVSVITILLQNKMRTCN